MISGIWPIVPLFGWSSYKPEGVLINCSVDWVSRTVNVVSYNITIFLAGYIIPLIVLIYTNVKLVQDVSKKVSKRK